MHAPPWSVANEWFVVELASGVARVVGSRPRRSSRVIRPNYSPDRQVGSVRCMA